MAQDRKYFGMTTGQLGILAGLAVVVCLLFGVTGFLALRRSLFSPPVESTPAIQATATPFVLPTMAPTATLTPIPYDQLIPEGWEQHQTTLVELWLPAGFKSTDRNTTSFVSGNSALVELSMTGISPTSAKDTVFVSIAYEPLVADSLDTLLDDRLTRLPAGANLVERRKVMVNSTEAYRLSFEWKNDNAYTNDEVFIFLDGSTIWYVKYSADIKDFFEMRSIFDDSVKTFRVVK